MNSDLVAVQAPAKINLQLSVGPVRTDGFHDLVTVFHAIDLCDTITVRDNENISGAEFGITVTGEGARFVPEDASNLAVKAAALLAQHHGITRTATIEIDKRIPVAGGMAGGSADAAGVLIACDRLWELHTPMTVLEQLAAQLGSDIPFSLHGGTAIGTGRGEVLSPVIATGEFHWVIALMDGGLSTPKVYAECDRLRAENVQAENQPSVSEPLLMALRQGDPELLARSLTNDLQPAAISLMPKLRRVIDTGLELGALAGIVSGSGPTCVFLAKDKDASIGLAAELAGSGVCRTVRTASGPVQGPR